MSFRSKTILGIAIIETLMLLVLVFHSLHFLHESNHDALQKRAESTVKIMATVIKDSLIVQDLATLEVLVNELINHSQLKQIKIYDAEENLIVEKIQALAELSGDNSFDTLLEFFISTDMILVETSITESGVSFGRIELEFSDEKIYRVLVNAQRKFIFLAVIGLLVSALFSYILGSYLTRHLQKLKSAASVIANGQVGYQIVTQGEDELAQTAQAFNQMSRRLQSSYKQLETNENRLASILNNVADGVLTIDKHLIISSFNEAAERVFGYQAKDVLGQPFSQLLSFSFHQQFEYFMFQNQTDSVCEVEGRNKQAQFFSMEVSVCPMLLDEQEYFNCTVRDITARKEAEKVLSMSRKVFENTSEAIMITDSNARIIDVNPAYERIMGYSRNEVLWKDPKITHSKKHDKTFYQNMWNSLKTDGCWEGEIWDRRKNGEPFPSLLTINAIKDSQARIVNYVAVFKDITQQKMNQLELEKLAHYDPLTALPNRVLFHDRLKHEIKQAKRKQGKSVLLFIDLDRFKQVNDTLGHTVGDELLIQVAKRLRSCIRESDTVARLGGDEFTAILSAINKIEDACRIAENMIRELKSPFMIETNVVSIGGSIGLAVYPDHGEDIESLINNADTAMYQAKEKGRGQCVMLSEPYHSEKPVNADAEI